MYVYVMAAIDGLMKIGMSINPEARCKSLYGRVVHVAGPFEDARIIETAAHRILKKAGKHVRSELFAVGGAVAPLEPTQVQPIPGEHVTSAEIRTHLLSQLSSSLPRSAMAAQLLKNLGFDPLTRYYLPSKDA